MVFDPLHRPSSSNINYTFDRHTVAMLTMLWTSNIENCGTSLKKDISKSKRPGYMKQSLIQPTAMMLCREPHKTVNVFVFVFVFFNLFIYYNPT